jgi:hypothetical protein
VSTPSDDPDQVIRKAGWRQGDLLCHRVAVQMLLHSVDHKPGVADEFWLSILTQDCDLVRDKKREPFVEMLVLTPQATSSKLSPGERGQSSRFLALSARSASGRLCLKASVHDRIRVRKSDFVSVARDRPEAADGYCLDHEERLLLVRWMARRYTRPPFPDAFEDCLQSTDDPVKRLFKSSDAKAVSTIFLRIEDDNPSEGSPFVLRAILAASANDLADQDLNRAILRFEEEFIRVFSQRPRIRFALRDEDDPGSVDVRVLPEEDITLAIVRNFRRFDADYRSVDDEDAAGPPAGLEA